MFRGRIGALIRQACCLSTFFISALAVAQQPSEEIPTAIPATASPTQVPVCTAPLVLDSEGFCCEQSQIGACDGKCNGVQPDPQDCYNCPGSPSQVKKDECGNCAGSGKDICGFCPQAYIGPFHPIFAPAPAGPNQCGSCGVPNLNQCGGCIGLADQPQPDLCGNCPDTPPDQVIPLQPCGKCSKDPAVCAPECPSGQVKDECGVCGGTGKICGECPSENSPKDLGCGCGKPAPNECGCDGKVKKAECGDTCVSPQQICSQNCKAFKVILNEPRATSPLKDDPLLVTGPIANLSCIQSIFRGCGSDNYTYYRGGRGWGGSSKTYERLPGESDEAFEKRKVDDFEKRWRSDDCVAQTLHTKYNEARMRAGLEPSDWFAFLINTSKYANSFQMDRNCRITVDVNESAICGESWVNHFDSPISINWASKRFADEIPSSVEFNLNLKTPEKNSLWFASGDFPLLVYDPKHTGSIDSAIQLFGNWTFGGKDKFSLLMRTSVESWKREEMRPWSNGFEALATLDSDHNGLVDKSELASLALWFDRNRNAVSESGEVIPVSELDIESIAYQRATLDRGNNSVVVEGSVSIRPTGAAQARALDAIDWYGNEFTSVAAADEYLASRKMFDSLHAAISAAPDGDRTLKPSTSVMQGYWQWKINDEHLSQQSAQLGQPMGILGMQVLDGKIVGRSIVEGPTGLSDGATATLMTVSPLFGTVKLQTGKPDEATFISRGVNGTYSRSSVQLASKDTLVGQTKMLYTDDTTSSQRMFTYSWTAQRVTKENPLPFGVK
jgi:hypothetical protein